MDTGNTGVKALIAALTPPPLYMLQRSPKSQLIIQTVCEQCGCVAVTIVISFSFPDPSCSQPTHLSKGKCAPTQTHIPARESQKQTALSAKDQALRSSFPLPPTVTLLHEISDFLYWLKRS